MTTLMEQIASARDRALELDRTPSGYTPVNEVTLALARDLHACGVLSKANVEEILDIHYRGLDGHLEMAQNSRIGGRLNGHTIGFLLDAHMAYRNGDFAAARMHALCAIPLTSVRMIAKVTGIPWPTLQRWVPRG